MITADIERTFSTIVLDAKIPEDEAASTNLFDKKIAVAYYQEHDTSQKPAMVRISAAKAEEIFNTALQCELANPAHLATMILANSAREATIWQEDYQGEKVTYSIQYAFPYAMGKHAFEQSSPSDHLDISFRYVIAIYQDTKLLYENNYPAAVSCIFTAPELCAMIDLDEEIKASKEEQLSKRIKSNTVIKNLLLPDKARDLFECLVTANSFNREFTESNILFPAVPPDGYIMWNLWVEHKYETYRTLYTFPENRVDKLENEIVGEFDKVSAIFKGNELVWAPTLPISNSFNIQRPVSSLEADRPHK
jgi:hypothetical protein